MLDTDLFIKRNLDHAFYQLTHCKVAGVNRGKGDFQLNCPRPVKSIKTKENMDRGLRGGGINGGVIVFAPNLQEYQDMMDSLEKTRRTR